MRVLATVLISSLLLASCGVRGQPVPVEDNISNVNVVKLMSIEGCNVYRFTDGGIWRYVTICPNRASVETTSGKNEFQYIETIGTSNRG